MQTDFVSKFYRGNIHGKRNLLRQTLNEIDVQFHEQTFTSCFGFGCNFYIGPDTPSKSLLLISAHYDGKGIYDNCGGVLQLLNLVADRKEKQFKEQIAYILTDLEECYQQGIYQFTISSLFTKPKVHLNIDGVGVGDKLLVMPYSKFSVSNFFQSKKLVTDNRVLSKVGIMSFQSFTLKNSDFSIVNGELEFSNSLKNYLSEDWLLTESIIYNNNLFYTAKYNLFIENICQDNYQTSQCIY